MNYNKLMVGYMLWMALAFLLFAKKPQDFGKFAGKMMAWWCSPIILIICLTIGFAERNKIRWFKKKWALVAINQFFQFLIYGMTGLTKKYG